MFNSPKTRWWFIFVLCFVAFSLWRVIFALPQIGVMQVCFFDIGQGDAILINHFNGNQVLIDGGPGEKIKEELGKCQPFYDRTLEAILLTHPDYDHLSGLIWILENYHVKRVFSSGLKKDIKTYKLFQKVIKDKGVPISYLRGGEVLDLGNKARLNILFPFPNTEVWAIKNPNNASVISRLIYGESSFLFTGDAEKDLEKKLTERKLNVKADILKVPHQGSRDAAWDRFLEAVDPKASIISVGAHNPYGHPHQQTLRLLKETQLLRTDLQGTIKIFTDGKRWEINTDSGGALQ